VERRRKTTRRTSSSKILRREWLLLANSKQRLGENSRLLLVNPSIRLWLKGGVLVPKSLTHIHQDSKAIASYDRITANVGGPIDYTP
jgi:hypothetical protein